MFLGAHNYLHLTELPTYYYFFAYILFFQALVTNIHRLLDYLCFFVDIRVTVSNFSSFKLEYSLNIV